ncbi:RidA family protein [Allokutzneria albata]|uniref:Enamine deaminase RidA, house cleaning of reactive enamine intermediates, YjgF/YER057c/UK114 family n=1 Tax=Allokutzneria albata TaxID=211114 RepID=A0A1G9SGY7_ALLAB|nr:RidA family protein [Allokutzneria albata]SDM34754.1 Enamine deaminase RidA, house cleaning of reactive enamine intermediates, YjgF/YER057c/UK114 family [Allokutzneria albata]
MEHIVAPERAGNAAALRYSHGVRVNGLVLFSGVTGTQPDGSVSADPRTQIEAAFNHLGLYLREAGLGFEHVVEITTYHVGLRRHLDSFLEVKDRFLREPYPAWTAIGVSELITEGALVEIRAVAQAVVA